jgi:hypothetical protein
MKILILVLRLMSKRPGALEALIKHLLERDKPFKSLGRDHWAGLGAIRVCMDIYGPEVHVGWSSRMINCGLVPFGLCHEESVSLYDAILSCIEGTASYEAKHRRLFNIAVGKMIQETDELIRSLEREHRDWS